MNIEKLAEELIKKMQQIFMRQLVMMPVDKDKTYWDTFDTRIHPLMLALVAQELQQVADEARRDGRIQGIEESASLVDCYKADCSKGQCMSRHFANKIRALLGKV